MTLLTTLRKYLLCCFLMLAGFYGHAAHYYVDSTATAGANNGTSWANAYLNLQTAINARPAGDTLWVAKGHYYPGTAGQNFNWFDIKIGQVLLGGFEGLAGAQETSASQRNFNLHRTILSGDLDQDGVHSAADAYHVINSAAKDTTAVVDGFTIELGNAVGPGGHSLGGGIFSFGGGGSYYNCVIQNNNSSDRGAGVHAIGSFKFIGCLFKNNTSASVGGAIGQSNATVKMLVHNCAFVGNTATSQAGAVYAEASNFQLFNCTFTGNSAAFGAALVTTSSTLQVRNCIMWGNPGTDIQGPVPVVNRNIIEGGYAAGFNILDVDPQFADANGRILACSPAVDAGDSLLSVTKDFDGLPRPFDGDGNAIAKWDLGAYEVQVVRAYPAPNPIVGPNPACANSFGNVYHVSTDNSPANTYLWTLPSGGSITGTNLNDSVNVNWGGVLGSYYVRVRETNAATGCSSKDSLLVSLQSAPTVSLNPTSNDSICIGDSLVVTVNGSGLSQQWYYNGSAISGATNTTIQAQQAGYYNAVMLGANGCRDSAATSLRLFLRPLPIVNFSSSVPIPICQGDLVTITGSAGQVHQWYRNGTLLSGAINNTYTTGLAGNYNMYQTDSHGCRDSAALALNLVVNALPIVNLSPTTIDTICIGDSLAITASANNPQSYQWFRNQTAIGSSNVNPFQANQTGVYNCRLTDTNGCTDSAAVGHQLISNDFVNPVAICRDITVHLNSSGNAGLVPAMIDNGSSDNCRIASYALSNSTMTCAQLGLNSILLTVTDFAGRTATCSSVVTVLDTIKPIVVCNPATVYLGSNGTLTLNPSVVGAASTDNCAISLATVSPNNFVCADSGAQVVLYTAMDASGNTRSCTTTITLADSTRPIANCQAVTLFLDGSGNASTTAGAVNNGSTDNCGIASQTLSQSTFGCTDVPGRTVTLTLTDISGNVSQCQSYVRVIDSVAPVAVCRDTLIYINFSGIANLTPSNLNNGSTDNCVIDSIWISQSNFTCADTGMNNISLFVTDADTNLSSCISIVTILDTIPPQAICTDTTFYLNALGIATVDPAVFGRFSFDNCTFFDTSYVNVGTFSCAQTGTHPVTLYVVDVNSRIDSCSGIVTIADSTAPISLCNNIAPILSPTGTVTITTGQVNNGSTDNCTISSLSLSQTTFTCADVGPNVVVLTVTDIFGNSSSCSSIVTVTDTVAPSALCQNIITYLNGAGTSTITASQIDNGSSDNCGLSTLSISATSFNCSQVGANAVTLTVTDTYGNAVTCGASVTVIDSIHPVANCQNLTVYLDANGTVSVAAAAVNNGSTDNCLISTSVLSQNSFACGQVGANTIALTVTDPSGLSATCSATVTVLDTIAPTTACLNGTFYLDQNGSLSLTVNDLASGTADNCSISSSTISQSAFTCSDLGANVLNLTFTDPSGNQAACAVTVTLEDSIAPVAVCQPSTIYLDGAGSASLQVTDINAVSQDACGIASYSLSNSAFLCGDVGLNLVTLSATDSSGNVGSCSANVTVLDTIAPAINCTTATVYLDANGSYLLMGSLLAGASTDVCTIDTAYAMPDLFSCANIGVNTVTVYVEDPSGNRDSCTTTFTLLDNLSPVADCDSVQLQLDNTGSAVLTPQLLGPNSSDNCGIDSSSISQVNFSCANTGWNPVTLTLWDSTGNQSTCTGYVMVIDTSGVSAAGVNLGSDITACNGDTLSLDAGAGMSSYLWSTGDTTQTIAVQLAGTYSVQVISPQGCAGRDTIVISSFVTPNPNLRSESGNNVVCLNDTLRLLVDPIFTNYTWSTGDMTSFTDITTGGNYSVIVEDGNGCELLQTIAVQFAPFPGPRPIINPNGNVGMCENTTVDLDAGLGYYAYLWNTGQTGQVITAFVPGFYNVQVWNGFGCHATSDSVQVSLLPAAFPTITRIADTLSTNTIAVSYQWYIGNLPILGANSRTYIATLNGSYKVRAYYSNGCDQVSAAVPFMVGLPDALDLVNGIDVFPNPSNGFMQLKTEQPVRKAIELRVTDMYGRALFHQKLKQLQDGFELDLTGLAAGMYLLEIKTSEVSSLRRIIIE